MKLRRVRLPQVGRTNVSVWNRDQMRRICSRLGLVRSKLEPRVPWDRFFVSDDRQYVYCSIPKVACSSWILALLRLTGRDISRVNSVHRFWLTDRYTYSAGLSRVLLMLKHQAHSTNRPTAMDEKKNVFSILVAISLVGIICGKPSKLLPLEAKMHQIRFRLGLPQTPLGSVQRSPRPLSWI